MRIRRHSVAVWLASLGFSSAFQQLKNKKTSVAVKETKDDLKRLAERTNPFPGYWDPLGVTELSPWGFTEEQTIGWLRHSEIKHGRVAQAAFVGYCVQSSWHWPWSMTLDGTPFPSTSISPPEQWDALPIANDSIGGLQHYTRGGIPGKYPTFDAIPHPVPFNLYDPFGLSKNMSDDTKRKRLSAEINNGRLAMIGIIGFLCEQKIPGSVPLLQGVVPSYAGEVMAPFEANLNL